jgi:hypothetical protein
MTTHTSTATLLLDGGRELAATASLAKDGEGTWSGSLAFPVAARMPELLNLTEGRLRVGDRKGAFVRTDTSDWLDSPAGLFRIRIDGNGDAPF